MEIAQDNNKIIHGLWIGELLSPLELLCIESFLQAGHSFYLWTYKPIANLPGNVKQMDAKSILPSDRIFSYTNINKYGHGKGSYAGFSDIFRYKLLYEYGGWWSDMDITCLHTLDFEDVYVFRMNGKKGIVGNLMKCEAGSTLMKYCYERATEEINSENSEWMLPINILNEGIRKFKLEKYKKEFTIEDSWPLVSSFLTTDHKIQESWYAVHWMNEEWRRHGLDKHAFIENSTIQQLLKKYNIVHGILKSKDSAKTQFTLSKWNYRFITLKARINWLMNQLF